MSFDMVSRFLVKKYCNCPKDLEMSGKNGKFAPFYTRMCAKVHSVRVTFR